MGDCVSKNGSPLVIAVIEGTTRRRRQSPGPATFVAEVGRTLDGVEIIYVDPVEFDLPGDGNDEEAKDPQYTAIVERADAFFVVTPEYNHSFPGSLKRLLDSELGHYVHKPVAFAGVSAGHWGGVRAVESLVPAVRELGLVATFTDVYFPSVGTLFSDGEIEPAQRERYEKSVRKAYDELLWMARALRNARRADS